MQRKYQLAAVVALIVIAAAPVEAYEQGQWILRAGVGSVDPKSGNLDLAANTEVDVDSGTSLTLTGTYMITQNWAFDILAAWPFSHDIDLVINGESGKLAETDHLPPTFSIQYHFLPDGNFQPYAGLGLNYTTFFNTDTVDEVGVPLDLDDSFGLALQLGADWALNDRWLLNLDLRWINIETDATLNGADIGTVEIDPLVYGVNVGYRF